MSKSIDKNLKTIGEYLFKNGQISTRLKDQIFLVCSFIHFVCLNVIYVIGSIGFFFLRESLSFVDCEFRFFYWSSYMVLGSVISFDFQLISTE